MRGASAHQPVDFADTAESVQPQPWAHIVLRGMGETFLNQHSDF